MPRPATTSPSNIAGHPFAPFALLQSSNRVLSRLDFLPIPENQKNGGQFWAGTSQVPCSNGVVKVALLLEAFYFRSALPFRPSFLFSSLLSLDFSSVTFLLLRVGIHSFLAYTLLL